MSKLLHVRLDDRSHAALSAIVLVIPTSTPARPTSCRPTIGIGDDRTQLLTEQITAIDTRRLGRKVGRVSPDELAEIETAIVEVLNSRRR